MIFFSKSDFIGSGKYGARQCVEKHVRGNANANANALSKVESMF